MTDLPSLGLIGENEYSITFCGLTIPVGTEGGLLSDLSADILGGDGLGLDGVAGLVAEANAALSPLAEVDTIGDILAGDDFVLNIDGTEDSGNTGLGVLLDPIDATPSADDPGLPFADVLTGENSIALLDAALTGDLSTVTSLAGLVPGAGDLLDALPLDNLPIETILGNMALMDSLFALTSALPLDAVPTLEVLDVVGQVASVLEDAGETVRVAELFGDLSNAVSLADGFDFL